ncbi:MAG: tripartite tricarboxylate transporter substrate binding protein [Minisyncoccia bacterium]
MRRSALTVALVLASSTAWADITCVVGFGPGGASSRIAQHVCQVFGEELGVKAHVENQPGAGGLNAIRHVLEHGKDGKTVLLFASTSTLKLKPGELTPVAQVSRSDFVFVQKDGLSSRTLSEFFDVMRSDESLQTYMTPGAGTIPHLAMVEIVKREKIPMRHVPSKGSNSAAIDVMGGHVSGVLIAFSDAIAPIQKGLRPLFVTSAKRSEKLPDVPTLLELGYDIDTAGWHAILVHPETPLRLFVQYDGAISFAAEKMPPALIELGFRGEYATSKEVYAQHSRDYDRWTKVAKDLGITP